MFKKRATAVVTYVPDKKFRWWRGLFAMLLLSWLPIAVLFYEAGLRQLTLSQVLGYWHIDNVQGPVVLLLFVTFMLAIPRFMNWLALPERRV